MSRFRRQCTPRRSIAGLGHPRTSGTFNFENGKWYKIRLEVSSKRLAGHIDSHDCFDVLIEDKKISLRFGDIEYCKPFGFATYLTKGEIKNLQIKTVKK